VITQVKSHQVSTTGQERHWSRHAIRYEDLFVDPFAAGVENPLWDALAAIDDPANKTVIDLGCGIGPLLTHLLARFGRVIALDFAPGMLAAARKRLSPEQAARVCFLERSMHQLEDLEGRIDVAVAVNSLVMPDVRVIDRTLRSIRACLHPQGALIGIVPAMDAIHYHTMLFLDQALDHGLDQAEAQRVAIEHAEHRYYDFAFGRFRFQGLRQKFWMPFELEYRLRKAGFGQPDLRQVRYPWDHGLVSGLELSNVPPSWDWFFRTGRGNEPARIGQAEIARPRGSP
jgi:ubiquinone/menaquinone biosynthesis C-methylase UbiE